MNKWFDAGVLLKKLLVGDTGLFERFIDML